ncbi:hypothetical protein [Aliivibrio sifiae]|uniref:hypothetical protein n=1 Tax=Aliivibrio sifiae TaxID=566293 RepID=UPI003D0C9C58
MKTNSVIGLFALCSSVFANANGTIVFPGQNVSSGGGSVVFPTAQHPVTLVGGYNIEGGVFKSRTYDCGINISDLNLTAKLVWEGATPKIEIVGDDVFICRSLVNSPFELDINSLLNKLPNHEMYRLEVANHVNIRR